MERTLLVPELKKRRLGNGQTGCWKGPALSSGDHKGPGSPTAQVASWGRPSALMEREAEFEPILHPGLHEGGKQLVYAGSSLSHCY